jgi:hypothetical protein
MDTRFSWIALSWAIVLGGAAIVFQAPAPLGVVIGYMLAMFGLVLLLITSLHARMQEQRKRAPNIVINDLNNHRRVLSLPEFEDMSRAEQIALMDLNPRIRSWHSRAIMGQMHSDMRRYFNLFEYKGGVLVFRAIRWFRKNLR